MIKFNSKKGFTLIEMLIYIMIASIIFIFTFNAGWNVFKASNHISVKQDVYTNTRIVANQFQKYIRGAGDILTDISVFNSNPGTLVLDYPGAGTDVIFDTYDKAVTIGGLPVTIKKMRIKEGAAAYVDLTNDKITVSNFSVKNFSRGSSKTVQISLTLDRVNPDNNPDFIASGSFTTSFTLR
jgi:prepilin-type N-terminal cleavage/methylation domain-containing protein